MLDRTSIIGALAGLNLSLFPVLPKDKKPAIHWKKYQETHATHDELEAWFGNGHAHNIGIATGRLSGIVVVDTDTTEGEQWVRENLPAPPFMVRTAKGVHRYYRHPGGRVGNKARIRDGVDIRGDGGYVLGPGSTHPSGVLYELIGELPSSLDESPIFDPAWIPTKAQPETQQVQRARSRSELKDQRRLVDQARAYVAKVPPAIGGQGGDEHTFTLVCRLVRGFDLTDAEAMDVLAGWNQSCEPQWFDRELEEKIQNARKYGTEPVGNRLGDDDRDPAASGKTQHNGSVTLNQAGGSYHFTDAGNAECFAARHGSQLRYDHQLGRWLEWASPIWRPDAVDSVFRLAKEAMRARFHDAGTLEHPDDVKRAAKWALQSENRPRLEALLRQAQAEPPFADAGRTWDTDPYLLACPNGVVELRTGALRPGRQTDRLTMLAGVPYDPDAQCPRWLRFLEEVFDGNTELIEYMHRVIGYCLTGETSEQCWWLWYGSGANGKGTMIRALANALGDYETCTPFSTFLYQASNTQTNDLARLRGRRFVWAQETAQNSRLNEERLKSLTGGDIVIARFLHREFFEFTPTLKLVLAVNHKPVIKDDSYGMWRRVRVIPFTQRFNIEKTLDSALAAEAPGILAWAVRGVLLWQAEGLSAPASVTSATGDYEAESDPLREFIDTSCDIDPNNTIGATDLFTHYTAWADREVLTTRDRMFKTMFGRCLGERFTKDRDAKGRVIYHGIGKS